MARYRLQDLSVGQSARRTHTVTEADVVAFAQVTGDTNPVHLDAEYAATTPFKQRIAHGALSAGYISGVMGVDLPGEGCVYLSQTLKFRKPVLIGDTVETTVVITAIDSERRRITLSTVCSVDGAPVVEGEALVMAPKDD